MDNVTGGRTEDMTFLVCAIVINSVQKWLKEHPAYQKLVTELPIADRWVHRAVAALIAGGFALGIHFTYSGSWATGWLFQGTVPSWAVLKHALGDWATVFFLQQGTYMWSKQDQPAGLTPEAYAGQVLVHVRKTLGLT